MVKVFLCEKRMVGERRSSTLWAVEEEEVLVLILAERQKA